jgi:hypothetical protein
VQHGLLARRAIALGDLDAQTRQLAQELGVGQARHVRQAQGLISQQARRHQLDGRVLGAADRDRPVQPRAAGDGDAIH